MLRGSFSSNLQYPAINYPPSPYLNQCELDSCWWTVYFWGGIKHYFIMKYKIHFHSFPTVLRWVSEKQLSENEPLLIPKYGSRSKRPFRVWSFAGCLLLMSNEEDSTQRQYILNRDKWDRFLKYVKDHSEMGSFILSQHYKEFGCTNKVFWPSIISICKEYSREKGLE